LQVGAEFGEASGLDRDHRRQERRLVEDGLPRDLPVQDPGFD